ncbi:hypothetical protein L6164_031416 [Bauhinia variegata]|uniref:Uncharacterized protein n=1 Tax=Bauhinia variegata TaxID=167791 RepID=A0ACB9LFN6_BAUVA|nr:hypothetical protein L6164_031416 [Bauhinia variegata]
MVMRFSLDDLCDEFLIEVLCRLPQKYVTQCKCVSKRWFSLISNPGFASQSVSHRLSNKEMNSSHGPSFTTIMLHEWKIQNLQILQG